MSQNIEIYSDGSCLGNPGPGGWAAMIKWNNEVEEICGSEPDTTNNRMEMSAVLEAFKFLNAKSISDSAISIYTDSNLVVSTFTKNWKKKQNKDLWALIEVEYAKLFSNGNSFSWNWVKGHAGHEENERVDDLARGEAEKIAN